VGVAFKESRPAFRVQIEMLVRALPLPPGRRLITTTRLIDDVTTRILIVD
jgi:hypothetical protein